MKQIMYLVFAVFSLSLASSVSFLGCADDKSYPFEGKYELTTAACDAPASSVKAATIESRAANIVFEITDDDFKVEKTLSTCMISENFHIDKVDDNMITFDGVKLEVSGDDPVCQELKKAAETQIDQKAEQSAQQTQYAYEDPVLKFTSPHTGKCSVFRKKGTGSQTLSSSSAPVEEGLAAWSGNHEIAASTESCHNLTTISNYNTKSLWPSKIASFEFEEKTINLNLKSSAYYCDATIKFPIESETSRSLTYLKSAISISTRPETSSSRCPEMETDLKSIVEQIHFARSEFDRDDSNARLEFTDPLSGVCYVLTR